MACETFLTPYVSDMLSFSAIHTTDETALWLQPDGIISWEMLPAYDVETDCELAAGAVKRLALHCEARLAPMSWAELYALFGARWAVLQHSDEIYDVWELYAAHTSSSSFSQDPPLELSSGGEDDGKFAREARATAIRGCCAPAHARLAAFTLLVTIVERALCATSAAADSSGARAAKWARALLSDCTGMICTRRFRV